jgi:SAM-dependent methyltransferase
LDEYPADENYVVLTRVSHNVPEWPVFTEPLHHAYETKEIATADDADDLRSILKTLAAATLVVGPDSWATQAAAALDCRVVMAMDLDREIERAPFNVVVVPGTKESILRAVEETLFEKRYPDYLNCGNAAEFIKCLAKKYMKAHFVDVGCSAWPIPNGIPVDMQNREVIEDASDNHFSGLFSSHCLEHITEWAQELTLWHRVIRPGGAMVLYLPHPRAEVWHAHTGSWVANQHVWNPEPVTLVRFLKEVLGMNIVEYTSRRDPLWSFHIVARKI